MTARNVQEIQLDGLVGPSHHYAGLSSGNIASAKNAASISNPREAALQGLKKMQYVASLGVPQMVMPPVMHEVFSLLRVYGFSGSEPAMLEAAYQHAPSLLASVFSAASMWTANAATITASADSADGKVHVTPANLVSKLHRSQEVNHTAAMLKTLFPGEQFVHHPAAPSSTGAGDEGAANHMRLCKNYNESGINIFVYGMEDHQPIENTCYFPRQHKAVCEMIARQHGWRDGQFFLLKQSPHAVDAGVFHNDVIALSSRNVMVYHARAYTPESLERLQEIELLGKAWPLTLRCVSDDELSLEDAVATYFFNSQLVEVDDAIHIIAPSECEAHDKARILFDRLVQEDNPIANVSYLNLRESMKNGGGPACLRLRVPVTKDELACVYQPAIMNDALYGRLTSWVERHYRDRLTVKDLQDIGFYRETMEAAQALSEHMALPHYPG